MTGDASVTRLCHRCGQLARDAVLRILDQGSGPGIARYHCPPCDRRFAAAGDLYGRLLAIARARRPPRP
jgi:hypothetical protein